DDVPAAEKRRRLNTLLDAQEAIGLERNRAFLGRTVEVLVDTIVPARSHDHADEGTAPGPVTDGARVLAAAGSDAGTDPGPDAVRLSGRSRENKLVHLMGPAALLGTLVAVRVDHAGPYALRGALA
ncbi:MAG TPA: hypothetical protein VF323_01360, partial [Candidatus Limnocylindrales bacterium]